MIRDTFPDLDARHTYATRANAMRKLEKFLGDSPASFRYVIAVTEGGRFYPVVVLQPDQTHWMFVLANNGICVTGGGG